MWDSTGLRWHKLALTLCVSMSTTVTGGENPQTNLFKNPGFEERDQVANMLRPNHWRFLYPPTSYSQHVVAVDNPHARSGNGAVRLDSIGILQTVQLEAGKTYTLSCYARYAGGPRGRMVIRTWGPRPMDRHTEVDLPGNEWTLVTDTLKPPKDQGYSLCFGTSINGMKVDVDDVQVRVGQATPREIEPTRPYEHVLPRFVDAYKSQEVLQAHPNVFRRWAYLMEAELPAAVSLDDPMDLADQLVQMRDDYRAQQVYRRLSQIKDLNLATRTLVGQRLSILEGRLRLRKAHEQAFSWLPNNYPGFFAKPTSSLWNVPEPLAWGHIKPSPDWDATLDEAYYFPWQSLAYLTVHVKQTQPAQIPIRINLYDRRNGKLLDVSNHRIQTGRPVTIPVPLVKAEQQSQPGAMYEIRLRGQRGQFSLPLRVFPIGIFTFLPPMLDEFKTVDVRDDGVLQVNGKPFVAMGWWDSYWSEGRMTRQRLLDQIIHGANMGPTHLPHVQHPAAAGAIGINKWTPQDLANVADLKITQDVRNFKRSLYWFFRDEPFFIVPQALGGEHSKSDPGGHFERFRQVNRYLRSADSGLPRPVMVDGLCKMYHYDPFAHVSDIYAVETYGLGLVGAQYGVRLIKEARRQAIRRNIDHPIALWHLPGMIGDETPYYLRAQSYAGMLEGAVGFFPFCYEFEGFHQGRYRNVAGADDNRYIGRVNPLGYSAMRGLNAELRELAPYITSTAGYRDIDVHPPKAVQAKLFQHEDGSAVVVAVGAHETTIFGKWTWKSVADRQAHRGQWKQPTVLPGFCNAGDLPKNPQKGQHGLIWMKPIELQEGEKIVQEVLVTKPVDNIKLHVVVDEKDPGLWYWQHPRVWHTGSWQGDNLRQHRWQTVQIDAKSSDLCGRKTVGFYFDTDDPTAVLWGRTFRQDRHGKKHIWFDHQTFRYAQKPHNKPIQFKIEGFEIRPGPVRVKFEPREVSMRSDRHWNDRMGFTNVHVYELNGYEPLHVHLAELSAKPIRENNHWRVQYTTQVVDDEGRSIPDALVRFLWLGAQEGFETVRCDSKGIARVTTEQANIGRQDSVVVIQGVYGTHTGRNLFFDWRVNGLRSKRVAAPQY